MEYTKRRNLNRGYLKLEARQRAPDLFVLVCELTDSASGFKLRSQPRDAAQSVSSNIAEGYGRRTLPECLQFLHAARGSLAETLTRTIGFNAVKAISSREFEQFDKLHCEVENKLLGLVHALETKRQNNGWRDTLPLRQSTDPIIHKSTNPP
jgi:four helix bundle protein